MDDKNSLSHELDEIQQELKELQIHYEQYFAGIERREPYNERKNLARRVRHFTNRQIIWTDLKFRYQGLASRFMSYGQYWDRILRLIDEGKYHRHTSKITPPAAKTPALAQSPQDEAVRIQQELSAARKALGLQGAAPSTDSVEVFLAAQREKIHNRYGDKPVTFSIDTSGDKPRIKVSLKK